MTKIDVLCCALESLCVLLEYIINASVIYIALVAFKRVLVSFKRMLAAFKWALSFWITADQCGQNPTNPYSLNPMVLWCHVPPTTLIRIPKGSLFWLICYVLNTRPLAILLYQSVHKTIQLSIYIQSKWHNNFTKEITQMIGTWNKLSEDLAKLESCPEISLQEKNSTVKMANVKSISQ